MGAGVHARRRGEHRVGQDGPQSPPGQIVVTQRDVDRVGDARTGDVVVHLVPEVPEPGVTERDRGVRRGAQVLGRHRGPFGRVGQLLQATIPALESGPRRPTARAVGR